jgi:ATP-dependent RNA helicase DDX52/ROK1
MGAQLWSPWEIHEVGARGWSRVAPDASHRPRRSATPAATFWDGGRSRLEDGGNLDIGHRSANMDPLKLLSRSTKLQKKQAAPAKDAQLPSGQQARPQLYASERNGADETASRKRKRGQPAKSHSATDATGPDFFGGGAVHATQGSQPPRESKLDNDNLSFEGDSANLDVDEDIEEEARKTLKQHKLKMTWLNPHATSKKSKRKAKEGKKEQNQHVYPRPLERFHTLRKRFAIPQRVQENVSDQGYDLATEVQMAALPLLLDNSHSFLHAPDSQEAVKHESSYIDLLAVAPTGSGKTLAFLIPLFSKIMRLRKEQSGSRHTTAVILAPTKELVGQIVNEGKKLGLNTGTKISQVRKGMNLDHSSATTDDVSEVKSEEENSSVKVDILVSTPGVLHSILEDKENQDRASLPAVESLVLDEADVLLDPLFREQTLAIWHRLAHPDLRVSLWSATMGSNIEDLARSTISARQKRLAEEKDVRVTDAPLVRLVVGLKDSAVPNIEHKLIYAATEQGKLMGLRQLLHPTTSSAESGPPLRPPFLVFTQTIERAVALHSELLYDIPAEAGGISRIAVLHSDLSDTARDSVMTRFRKGEVWVLITTDLLSRGVDFRGVNGVVNYDIPTSSAAYVHRVGRTGRAGRQGGVAVTLYSKEDIPYMKHVATVVSMAQKQQGAAAGDGVQQWLLDALPSLSKNDKQKFKKRGVEVRTARGMASDPRGAKKARISTKAGYVRREENKRKGAIAGSKQRAKLQPKEDDGNGSDFGGFD